MDKDLESIQEVRFLVRQAKRAQEALYNYSQEQIDRICRAMAEAAFARSEELARIAVEETGMGHVAGKTIKNQFSSRDIWNAIKDMKTVGVIGADEARKVYEIGEPAGIVCGIVPCTNPTSTAMFKAIISIKARNAIVISPHPRSLKCIQATVEVVYRAALEAGAPPDCISCMSIPLLEGTSELMKHEDVAVILATGGSGLVHAAYSSGKPAYGVGPGNVPVVIERSANVPQAVADIIASQQLDYGTICASEQAVIVDAPVKDRVIEEFKRQKGYFASPEECKKLEPVVIKGSLMNPEIVGLPPHKVAAKAGITIPEDTTVLLCPQEGVGPKWPLSREKLCPVLAFYVEKDWEAACERSVEILEFGGIGHTLALHSEDPKVIWEYAFRKPSFRVLINSPSSQGAIGYTTNLFPSMSLGCGTWAGNITSDNISPRHLMNIKRVAWGKGCATPATAGQQGMGQAEGLRRWAEQPRQPYPSMVAAQGYRGAAPGAGGAQPLGGVSVPITASAGRPVAYAPGGAPTPIVPARGFVCPVTSCPESSRGSCHGCS